MLMDQAAINAGRDFRLYAMKPMPAKPVRESVNREAPIVEGYRVTDHAPASAFPQSVSLRSGLKTPLKRFG
jgi:hypothetical protein